MEAAKVDAETEQPALADGSAAVIAIERLAADAAATCGTAPSARMGDLWRAAVAAGALNAHQHPLILLDTTDPAGALAALTGAALAGQRVTGFLAGDALAALAPALSGVAGKGLPLVLHVAANATPRQGSALGAGHDGYHAVAGSGAVQFFARDAQAAADLALAARHIAEAALVPALVAQDAELTSHEWQPVRRPGAAGIAAYLGAPADLIDSPSPAQRVLFGARRRRVPAWWSVDHAASTGGLRGAESYALGAAAQRIYQFAQVPALADAALAALAQLTGRHYARLAAQGAKDADYLLIAQGAAVPLLEAAATHLRKTRRLKVGVLDITMFRPFPADLLAPLLAGRKGVAVLERIDQPLAGDAPLMHEVRGVVARCLENGAAGRGETPHAGLPAFKRTESAPPLYSVIYGLGGQALSADDCVAVVQNMLPQGRRQRQSALAAAMPAAEALSPKQEILQQTLSAAYPALAALSPGKAEVGDLLPAQHLALRIAGRHAVDPLVGDPTLAQALYDLTGRPVRARMARRADAPGRFAETDVLAAAEPLPASSYPAAVALLAVTHPVALRQAHLLEGLVRGGTLLIVAAAKDASHVWVQVPLAAQRQIRARELRVFHIDAEHIAREAPPAAGDVARATAMVLQGALLSLPPVAAFTGLSAKALQRALGEMVVKRHGDDASEVVQAQTQLYLQGSETVYQLAAPDVAQQPAGIIAALAAALPAALRAQPVDATPALDLHRLWGEAGLQAGPQASGAVMADPFVASGAMPAGSGMLCDLSAQRETMPTWIPERCTGCGDCWMVCPDSALPARVSPIAEVLQTAQRRITQRGEAVAHLPPAVRTLEGQWRALIAADSAGPPAVHLAAAIEQTLAKSRLPAEDKLQLGRELGWLQEELAACQFAATAPFFTSRGNSGGLLSLTINPSRCQGCQACVMSCGEQALVAELQTDEALAAQQRRWAFFNDLPNTDPSFISATPAGDGGPGLQTLLLDRDAYEAMPGGAHGSPGAAENTILRLVAAAAVAGMKPRVAAHLARVDEMIEQMEQHIRLNLAVDVADPAALLKAADALRDRDFTLSELSAELDREHRPVDADWLTHVTGLLAGLKRLKTRYAQGSGGRARAHLGMVQDVADPSGWPVSYPFTPFLFPWSGADAALAAETALGLYEGHMARMAQGFKVLRQAALELDGKYNRVVHDPAFARFGWRDFDETELALCPPLIVTGDERTLTGTGLAGLTRLLRRELPVKVLVLDGGAWRHLLHPVPHALSAAVREGGALARPADAGDPCAGGLAALAGMAQRNTFVLHSSLADIPRLMQGLLDGFATPRPAVFDLYVSRLPGHPPGSSLAVAQAHLALEARAHVEFRYDPDRGGATHERLLLDDNPALDDAWQASTLRHLDGTGNAEDMDIILTYADFAATVPGLQQHFTPLADGDARHALAPLAEVLELEGEERAEAVPFIWGVNPAGRAVRLAVSAPLVRTVASRQALWQFLRTLARRDIVPVDEEAIAEQARQGVVAQVTASLVQLANSGDALAEQLAGMAGSDADRPEGEASEAIN